MYIYIYIYITCIYACIYLVGSNIYSNASWRIEIVLQFGRDKIESKLS